MSAVIATVIGIDCIRICVWASISPGISTRPPPSMTVVFALRSVGIGEVEMCSIQIASNQYIRRRRELPHSVQDTNILKQCHRNRTSCSRRLGVELKSKDAVEDNNE